MTSSVSNDTAPSGGSTNDPNSAHVFPHLANHHPTQTVEEQSSSDPSPNATSRHTADPFLEGDTTLSQPSESEGSGLRHHTEAVKIERCDQAAVVKPDAPGVPVPPGGVSGDGDEPPSPSSPPRLSALRSGARRFTVTRLEEVPRRLKTAASADLVTSSDPTVEPKATPEESAKLKDCACGGAASVDRDDPPEWDWDTPPPPPTAVLAEAAAQVMQSPFPGRDVIHRPNITPRSGFATVGGGANGWGLVLARQGHGYTIGSRDITGAQANYATVQGGLSAPLLRHLTSPGYNPSHTISYGHSDGTHLTVRRLLDWEVPDLHTVRKYTSDVSDSDLDSVSTRSVVPTHRGRHHRRTWTNKVEFVLACLGYAVGLSNLWRFPYLCYKSGGGAFLIPYLIMMFACSVSLLMMEMIVGQFTRQGPVGAMGRLCPLLKGAGVAPVIVSFLFCTYYNVVIAWALFYLFSSFATDVPWKHCNNTWNMPTCEDALVANKSINATTPSEEFFNRRVLELTSGVDQVGGVRVSLMLTLLLAWVLVYFSIWKSIRSSGKVVYVTVIAPYLLLAAFLWRALTLDGASSGVRFLFNPRWELLKDAKVWINAAAQNFNSVGIGYGPMITFASYNKFQNRSLLMDTLIISSVNLLTSVVAGVIVFATLGNIALELNRPIDKVVVDGPGLVYVAYPKALASMPVPQLWAVLFFLMLLCLGLDSQFATLEVVITSLQDAYGSLVRRYLRRHELLVLVICLVSLGLGLPYVTQGGMYIFQLVDYHVANNSLMVLAFFEVVAVAWIYGTDRLSQDYYTMTGKRPSQYFRFCWKFLAPAFILAIWIFSVIDRESATYGTYVYPRWAIRLGWLLSMLPVLPIPVCAVLALWRAPGKTLMERVKASVQPDRRVRSEVGYEPTIGGPDELVLNNHRLAYELQPVTGGHSLHPGLAVHPAYSTTIRQLGEQHE